MLEGVTITSIKVDPATGDLYYTTPNSIGSATQKKILFSGLDNPQNFQIQDRYSSQQVPSWETD